MAKTKRLWEQAADFGNHIAELFNQTLSSHVRLTTLERDDESIFLGYKLDKLAPTRGPGFMVGQPGDGFPTLYFRPHFLLALDQWELKYLTVESSVFLLAADEQMTDELLHIDFERGKGDGYPNAHLQILAESDLWTETLCDIGEKEGRFRDFTSRSAAAASDRQSRTSLSFLLSRNWPGPIARTRSAWNYSVHRGMIST